MRDAPLRLIAQAPGLPWQWRKRAIGVLMQRDSEASIEARCGAIDYCADLAIADGRGGNVGPIWQFWNTGQTEFPPLVQNCLQSVLGYAGERQRVLVTMKTVGDYVDLPGAVMDRRAFWGWTKFSNLLRLKLLERHGGTWIDATVLLAAPLPDVIQTAPFFAAKWNHDPRIIANWLIQSVSGHPLIAAMSTAYERYWMTAEVPGDYFMFHFIFEALILSSRRLQTLWDQVPDQDAKLNHELQHRLDEAFNPVVLAEIARRAPIQKLTLKHQPPRAAEETFWAALNRPNFVSQLTR
ncbi:MAG: capsular polysaccharide synthesis protein [Nevskia sp.]|nr:capsular polysaccharide synthesis protein [Nevskia sp.]